MNEPGDGRASDKRHGRNHETLPHMTGKDHPLSLILLECENKEERVAAGAKYGAIGDVRVK